MTTKGEFVTALETFRGCLQVATLVLLKSTKEQKELQEFIRKVSEYVAAMRIELERKKIVGSVSMESFKVNRDPPRTLLRLELQN